MQNLNGILTFTSLNGLLGSVQPNYRFGCKDDAQCGGGVYQNFEIGIFQLKLGHILRVWASSEVFVLKKTRKTLFLKVQWNFVLFKSWFKPILFVLYSNKPWFK